MNPANSHKRTTIFYTLATGLYYSGQAVIMGYTVVFLTSRGVPDSISGLVVSFSAIGAIIMQMFVANSLDRNPLAFVKNPTIVVAVLQAIVITAMLLLEDIPIAVLICYTLGLIGTRVNMTLLNSIAVKSDIHIPFAIPRGLGSATYAFTCLLAGYMASSLGINSIFYFYIPIAIFQAVSLIMMPEDHLVPEVKETVKEENVSYAEMLSKNKILAVFLIACIFNGIGMTASGTFLIRIIEDCGGNSTDLGIILFVQAFAEVPMSLVITRFTRNFGLEKVLTFSFLMFAVRCFLFAAAGSVMMVGLIACLNMFCYGIYGIAYVQFPDLIVKDTEKARAQALTALCSGQGIGLVFGSALSGALITLVGARMLFVISGFISIIGFVAMYACASMLNKQKALARQ